MKTKTLLTCVLMLTSMSANTKETKQTKPAQEEPSLMSRASDALSDGWQRLSSAPSRAPSTEDLKAVIAGLKKNTAAAGNAVYNMNANVAGKVGMGELASDVLLVATIVHAYQQLRQAYVDSGTTITTTMVNRRKIVASTYSRQVSFSRCLNFLSNTAFSATPALAMTYIKRLMAAGLLKKGTEWTVQTMAEIFAPTEKDAQAMIKQLADAARNIDTSYHALKNAVATGITG